MPAGRLFLADRGACSVGDALGFLSLAELEN